MKHRRPMKTVLFFAILLGSARMVTAAPSDAVIDAEARRVATVARAKDAVVAIFPLEGKGGGSGVVISPDGYALTNFHVVGPTGYAMKCGMADGTVYDAVLVGLDPTGDVALIRLFGRDEFPAATLGDSDEVRVGDTVYAMGNPFLLATDFQPTVTRGIISGTHRYQFPSGTLLEYADCLQTDASINPGNSGGPLFDAEGRLIGINGRCSFEKRGRVSVDVGYAISINQIKNFLGCLRSGRIVDHATAGILVGADDTGRVVVDDILSDSDAFRRGLRYGDEIVAFGGRTVTTPNAFKNVLGIFPKGWRLPLTYLRNGERKTISIRLSGVHRSDELLEKIRKQEPVEPAPPDEPNPEKGEKPGPPIKRIEEEKLPIPDVVKKHYEARRGFANYFYNRLHRDRVLAAWRKSGVPDNRALAWTWHGKFPGGEYDVTLDNETSEFRLAEGGWEIRAGADVEESLAPPGSGGLLLALSLWRRLAVDGAENFGEVVYFGTAPLAGTAGLGGDTKDGDTKGDDTKGDATKADVLRGTAAGADCWFYFQPKTGELLAMEMFPGPGADPCELRFVDYKDTAAGRMPSVVKLRFGEEVAAEFSVDEVDLQSSKKETPSPANEAK